jgi:hypothetical protein
LLRGLSPEVVNDDGHFGGGSAKRLCGFFGIVSEMDELISTEGR